MRREREEGETARGWAGKTRATHLSLNPLSPQDVLRHHRLFLPRLLWRKDRLVRVQPTVLPLPRGCLFLASSLGTAGRRAMVRVMVR